jgi:hypothetical protein
MANEQNVKFDREICVGILSDCDKTPRKVAAELIKDDSQVRQWFSGKRGVSKRNADRVAALLKCTVDQLTGEEHYERRKRDEPLDFSPSPDAINKDRCVNFFELLMELFPGKRLETILELLGRVLQDLHHALQLDGVMKDGVINSHAESGSVIIIGEYTKDDTARIVSAWLAGELDQFCILSFEIEVDPKKISRHIQSKELSLGVLTDNADADD